MKGFPRRFGSYVLAKPLARGGMGALYLAVAGGKVRGRTCVIKTVLPHLADKEYLQRFRDEAKVVVQLSHRNLVPVFDSGEVGGEIYLGMDFIDGRDLRAVWNRCAKKGVAFPMDVAAFIVRELAQGLQYAHTFGDIRLVHRDVSPPNVLVAYDGSVKLTDFGLASSTLKMEKTAPGIIYGKVSYMSPEQARAEKLDGRTDLFASGIILWELLTGRQLFPATAQAQAGAPPPDPRDANPGGEELLRRVRNPDITPPSKRASRVPAELDRIVMRALAPRLEDRYATCAELAADLTKFLDAKYPMADAARVATFLGSLWGDEIQGERAERALILNEARSMLEAPPPRSGKAKSQSQPLSSLTMPVVPLPTGRRPAGAPPPPPPRRSGKGTIVDVDAAAAAAGVATGTRHRPNTVSSAMDDTVASASNPSSVGSSAGSSVGSSVVGSLVGGKYKIRRLCGEGGMGRVYEAEHIEIGKRVALKILHPGYSQTPDLVERLRREARAASRIGHPNVVDVTDSGTTDDGAFFFVMEYLEGKELGDIVFDEKGISVQRALGIAMQICRALQAAHVAGVIHRDLKPENVLIIERDDRKEFVKVLDFGIAKNVTDRDDENPTQSQRRKLTHPGVAMGTPEYMAPEQAAGRPADVRSDVYALGGVLYEMLTGKAAFDGSNFMEVLHKKANEAPPSIRSVRDDVPPALDALIARTMAKDPNARPQSMDELEQLLQDIADTLPPDPASSGRRPSSGRRAVVPAAGGVAVWDWVIGDRRRTAAVAGTALMAVFLVGVSLSRAARGRSGGDIAVAAQPASSPPNPVVAVAPPSHPSAVIAMPTTVVTPAAEPSAAAAEGQAEAAEPSERPGTADDEKVDGDDEPTTKSVGARTRTGASAAERRKSLDEANELLRAQRFPEARQAFQRLVKQRATRSRALVALAEIAFQEKNYDEAVRSAKLAAERGGGARARVLLGDAHFRLSHYKDAAAAYEQALRLEPGNPSAKTGLALASKRL